MKKKSSVTRTVEQLKRFTERKGLLQLPPRLQELQIEAPYQRSRSQGQAAMDRRGEANHRGWSSSRGRGWRGRGRSGGGGGRPSPPPPSSTASSAAVNHAPAVTVNDAAPIVGTCPDMCPGNPRLWSVLTSALAACSVKAVAPAVLMLPWRQRAPPVRRNHASSAIQIDRPRGAWAHGCHGFRCSEGTSAEGAAEGPVRA